MSDTINKDMKIEEILNKFPSKAMQLSEIMTNSGLHCIGCGAAAFETLEQGMIGHGFSSEDLEKLLVELNAVMNKKTELIKNSEKIVTLTDSAINKVKELLKQENKENFGLRVSIVAGGCAGYYYDLELKEKPEENDVQINQGELKIFIDNNSAQFLKGVEIDFINTLKESGFRFKNPNSSENCSCGKSFG